mmetsp:Transcript_24880/g.56749  ORF Transcript_24880/g.56749 Transcript_24880/m.56749 type:complete len:290 (-) Transcript_24880:1614-2483(-)
MSLSCFRRAAAVVLCLTEVSSAFLPTWVPGASIQAIPDLNRYTTVFADEPMDVRLTVGLTKENVFVIDGFQFQLAGTLADGASATPSAKGVPLPGANGPKPHLSSGAMTVTCEQPGKYINLQGLQRVELTGGVWEIIWRENSPAGILICGFHLASDAERNDCIMERGNIYLTFPIWSEDGLRRERAKKEKAQIEYDEHAMERDNELELMKETPNLLMKALHFRQACQATQKMDFSDLHHYVDVPSTSDVKIFGELHCVKTGTVWRTNGNAFNEPFRSAKQRLLGSASLL